ncbi:MAG: hypothetical protein EOQ44_25110 [Mesorhizobium sp.]|uniref:hypothetical protein n=1 Tax=Mesorhizobium sp. TaxID=1871066 RepID=UPI000FE850E1|nr:hypothetical protein [Mesorhizobium sp.]RWB40425.1 MAG: hypothetical protein EOQ44_25110 [Mesorhizobium sp.]
MDVEQASEEIGLLFFLEKYDPESEQKRVLVGVISLEIFFEDFECRYLILGQLGSGKIDMRVVVSEPLVSELTIYASAESSDVEVDIDVGHGRLKMYWTPSLAMK